MPLRSVALICSFFCCRFGAQRCEDFAVAKADTLYRCLDKLLARKEAFFAALKTHRQALLGANLTSSFMT